VNVSIGKQGNAAEEGGVARTMPGAGLPERATTTLRRCSVSPAIGRVGVPGKRCRSRHLYAEQHVADGGEDRRIYLVIHIREAPNDSARAVGVLEMS